jgi:hypothetical protein
LLILSVFMSLGAFFYLFFMLQLADYMHM